MTDRIETFGNRTPSTPEPDICPEEKFRLKLEKHLAVIYPDLDRQPNVDRIVDVCQRYQSEIERSDNPLWNHQDVVLICYGDHVHAGSRPTLEVMDQFLRSLNLDSLINTIHLLPINPYTSDDGFSVVDYREIDPRLGTWDDVDRLNKHFDLMLDLVLNHCSQKSDWFQKFCQRVEPFTDYFIEVDPNEDLSSVVRPRNLPLLSEKQTTDGPSFVWTTFSDDQIDLNFACPDVMIEFLEILLLYARHGARIIRLDAIAYLWKRLGTSCIHLPETHEVVKLMRTVLEHVAPRTLLMTETNVPHRENISYFGDGDEAQTVYQFSLPPLMLDGYLQENASTISNWLKTVCQSPARTTFFNFTASHDGIGVRPLEGLVPRENLDQIVEHTHACGGQVGMKSNADGTTSPYELNVTYLDLLLTHSDDGHAADQPNIDRFMASQAIMLAVKGIPGIYFHSLFGTENDIEAARESQIPRRINRRKFDVNELQQRLEQSGSVPQRVFERYQHLLEIRRSQIAFHPDSAQKVIDDPNEQLLIFQRLDPPSGQQVTVVANFSSAEQRVELNRLPEASVKLDLISGKSVTDHVVRVGPFGILWLQ